MAERVCDKRNGRTICCVVKRTAYTQNVRRHEPLRELLRKDTALATRKASRTAKTTKPTRKVTTSTPMQAQEAQEPSYEMYRELAAHKARARVKRIKDEDQRAAW